MPEALRNQPRWRYWAARAAGQLGERDVARAGYAAVVPTDNWYAALAAARLDQRFSPTLEPLPRSEAEFARVAADPALVRTRELILSGMPGEARLEWRVAFEALTPEQQRQAVRLASGWGWHLQAIAAAASLGLFNDYELLYPRPFDDEVRRAAQASRLPPSLIYAVIRQESLFQTRRRLERRRARPDAVAAGDGTTTARKAGLPPPSRSSLLHPSVNIPLGSAFLRDLHRSCGGQQPLAIAGYNAGPAAARRWLPASPLETDIWVENIPFNETRAYVQRVHWHSLVFDWLEDRKPRDVSPWLGQVTPPSDTRPET